MPNEPKKMTEKTRQYVKGVKYREIKKSLLSQLQEIGKTEKHYEDLVLDYMDLWVTKCLLVDDIQERGVNVTYNNGGGQKGSKRNDSIELRIKVNNQMLKIISELGLKQSLYGGGDDDL